MYGEFIYVNFINKFVVLETGGFRFKRIRFYRVTLLSPKFSDDMNF